MSCKIWCKKYRYKHINTQKISLYSINIVHDHFYVICQKHHFKTLHWLKCCLLLLRQLCLYLSLQYWKGSIKMLNRLIYKLHIHTRHLNSRRVKSFQRQKNMTYNIYIFSFYKCSCSITRICKKVNTYNKKMDNIYVFEYIFVVIDKSIFEM